MAASGLVLRDPVPATNIKLNNESRPSAESAAVDFINVGVLMLGETFVSELFLYTPCRVDVVSEPL